MTTLDATRAMDVRFPPPRVRGLVNAPSSVAALGSHHCRILEHHESGGIVAGWEHWNDYDVLDLERLGLLRGQWIGSLDDAPHPYWSVTDAGREVLAAYRAAAICEEYGWESMGPIPDQVGT